MNILKLTAAAVAVLALTACSRDGGTAGVSSELSVKGVQKETVSYDKELNDQRTAKDSQVVSGLNFELAALRPVISQAGVTNLGGYVYNVLYMGADLFPFESHMKKLGLGNLGDKPNAAQIEAAKARIEQLKADADKFPHIAQSNAEQQNCLELVVAGDGAQARACFEDYFTRIDAAMIILALTAPHPRMQFTEERVVGFEKQREICVRKGSSCDDSEIQTMLKTTLAMQRVSQTLSPRLLNGLEGRILTNEDDAKRQVVENLFKQSPAEIRKLAAVRAARVEYLTEPGEVQSPLKVTLVESGQHFIYDAKGVTEYQNGAIWHGDSVLAGGRRELSFEKSAGANLTAKYSNSQDAEASNSSSTKAGADLKTGG